MTVSDNTSRVIVIGGAAAGGYALASAVDGSLREQGRRSLLWVGLASVLGAYGGGMATMFALNVTGAIPKGCSR